MCSLFKTSSNGFASSIRWAIVLFRAGPSWRGSPASSNRGSWASFLYTYGNIIALSDSENVAWAASSISTCVKWNPLELCESTHVSNIELVAQLTAMILYCKVNWHTSLVFKSKYRESMAHNKKTNAALWHRAGKNGEAHQTFWTSLSQDGAQPFTL